MISYASSFLSGPVLTLSLGVTVADLDQIDRVNFKVAMVYFTWIKVVRTLLFFRLIA